MNCSSKWQKTPNTMLLWSFKIIDWTTLSCSKSLRTVLPSCSSSSAARFWELDTTKNQNDFLFALPLSFVPWLWQLSGIFGFEEDPINVFDIDHFMYFIPRIMAITIIAMAKPLIILSANALLAWVSAPCKCTTAFAVCCSAYCRLKSIRSITVPVVTTKLFRSL